LATSPRVAWATLLKRTYSVDAMVCPRCGSRLRWMAVINDRATARKIIDHIGIPPHPKPSPRARGPDHLEQPPEVTKSSSTILTRETLPSDSAGVTAKVRHVARGN
jgi:hypothetical protein